MASYRDKQNQRKLETESGKIAWCIERIAHDYSMRNQFYINKKMDLFDEVKEEMHCSYELWKESYCCVVVKTDQFGETWTKVIPFFGGNWEVYKNILNAQPWHYL